MLVVTSVASLPCAEMPETHAVKAIFEYWGYDYRIHLDYLWHGWASKMDWLIEACHRFTEATHIMFVDARDVVVLCPPDELMERWAKFNHPWVYGAEPFIWSPGSFQPEDYPTPPNAMYRYLNSGVSIGEREHMLKWLNKWTDNGKSPPVCLKGDQDWMAARFIESYPDAIKLDTGCELFQNMCGSLVGDTPNCVITPGNVYNRITNTHPAVAHFNGGDVITEPERRGLWEHFSKNPVDG